MNKWNHYQCHKCGGVTIARHDDEGVTPFMIRCRARDTVSETVHAHGCEAMAESQFFNCSQEDSQTPHVIFFRPDALGAINWINKHSKNPHSAAWELDHYQKGGSLMRESYESL